MAQPGRRMLGRAELRSWGRDCGQQTGWWAKRPVWLYSCLCMWGGWRSRQTPKAAVTRLGCSLLGFGGVREGSGCRKSYPEPVGGAL
jgi:hypothetical protein